MSRRLFGLATLVLAAGAAGAAEWPGFRGPGGRGVVADTNLPLRWSKHDNVRWRAALPGVGLSGPVVAGGRVYVTACSGPRQQRLHVLCFDRDTGQPCWQRSLTATGNTMCNPETNMAAATPAADATGVYALFGTGDVAALDRDGALCWYRSLAGDHPNLTNQVGMAASPLLAGDLLILPMDNAGDSFVAALDRRTGRTVWRLPRDREVTWASPILLPDAAPPTLLLQSPARIMAHEAATGKTLWTRDIAGLSAIKSPAAADGRVFVAGDRLHALRLSDGGAEADWQAGNLAQGYASPVGRGDRVYYLTAVAAVCLDAATGKERWRRRLDGPFDASPLLAGDRLYAVNNRGRTTVLQLGDSPRVLARNDLDERLQATPAAAHGCLFFRSANELICVGPSRD